MKKRIILILTICIAVLFVLFGIVIVYAVIDQSRQEAILKKEILNITNLNSLTEDVDMTIKSSDNYAYIESSVKKYYREVFKYSKIIYSTYTNEELLNAFNIENIISDGKEFSKTLNLLNYTKEKSNNALRDVKKILTKEYIENLIDKKKIDDYDYELYEQLMLTENDIKQLDDTKKILDNFNDLSNRFLDKEIEMITFLRDNSTLWNIVDDQIIFETEQCYNIYKKMLLELSNISGDILEIYNQNSSYKNDSNSL